MFLLHSIAKILHGTSLSTAIFICVKNCSKTYTLPRVHPLQMTDDNRA